jgi:adenylate cyclase
MSVSQTDGAAVINGDVVGYSKLIADNEIETYQTLKAFRAIIESVLEEHGGRIVEFVGDEFLAVVDSAADGVDATVDVQRRLASENERLPDGRKLRFRLGLNVGPLFVEDGHWFGDAINVAARLQAMAKPGGVCVSGPALDAAGDVAVSVTSLGKQRLKNIPEPVMAYEIVDSDIPVVASAPWRRRIPAPDRPSIAASPFVNFGDPDDDHFADGLMMSIVIKLMTIPGLDVVSETSTFAYRDQAYSAQQLGHELGVRYVLEGGVHRSGSRVRVLAQMIDVEDGSTAWADRFDAEISDVFAAQDDIVSQIVAALDVEVIGGDLAASYREHLDSETVEVLYRGLHAVSLGTQQSMERSFGFFEEVIEREPDVFIGYALLGWAHFWGALSGAVADPDPHYAIAKVHAQKAVDHDDDSGLGYLVLAHVLLLERDWDAAREAADHLTAARPSCDVSLGVAASVSRYLGDWEQAVSLASRAIDLSPLMSDWYRSTLANALFIGEDYEGAADMAEGVVAGDESNTDALLTLAASQAALGQERHASAAIDHARETEPGLSTGGLRHDLPFRDTDTKERFLTRLGDAGLD